MSFMAKQRAILIKGFFFVGIIKGFLIKHDCVHLEVSRCVLSIYDHFIWSDTIIELDFDVILK